MAKTTMTYMREVRQRWGVFIINRITGQNIKKWGKVGGANDMSRCRNRPAPPLADNHALS